MPFVNVRTNVCVSKETEAILIDTLGKGIEVINNKSRVGLFIKIEGDCALYKAGKSDMPNAMVSVDLFGYSETADLDAYGKLVSDVLEEQLGVQSDVLFINFTECRQWFSGGKCNKAYDVE